ncbi:anthocyanin regulatory R-S protein-like isoform X2 [Phragmites australis]|nr:anthocyanin regulatory R-S protein-like isoform X2 [Phragmites australis]XP_062226391.1 anthocyanin regulatory R-S protein-like isoform X2 [Phragmites australis]XP_062226392.1 anthocyanin regulatory R-S protein-like isoform X2 [Phragmites australis]XP_062226393.1 anthocyanin regulatory R-S protein-like isoform X2 [Phragmites australis]XP_062226394.1 anthocyanin regulatory R-S protein-like isoform X2 [Phragmites australis]XP_062226395.1 anthocyanin regulatory R-S protein-like isoform X2 [Phr
MAMALSASPVHQDPQLGKQLRNQLAAVVRSINWSYAFFWSPSSTQPGVLTWKDGFYNGEIKTRKIANSAELTADQLVMQRSKQLRELYESLLSGECNHRAARPIASLSPEDLGDTEWYYVVCMTYAFRPGQGLPGRSFASNEHVWLCNAHLADSKAFPRALLAKSASIQTIICVPLMSGVLELGTTDSVMEDPDVVTQATTSFWELQFPACTEEPSSSPSTDETGKAPDIILFEDLDHNAMETMIAGAQELGEVERLSNASLEHITTEIDEFYSLCEELDVQPVEDDWIMDGSFEVPSSPQPALRATTTSSNTPADGSHLTSFTAWTRSSDYDEMMVPTIREPQKLLKKVVTGGSWMNSARGGSTRRTQESGIKNHVMTERRRREKLNEMFVILKSLVPSIHKVDKASILAETIAYLKELERRVQELESSRELISHPDEARGQKRHDREIIEKRASGAKRKKASELRADMEGEHNWVLSKDGTSNVTVTVTEKDVLLEVQCRWEELLVTRVFDAIKSLHLDVLSVQASTPDGFMGLKIRAQFTSAAAVVPVMISEALRKAICKR